MRVLDQVPLACLWACPECTTAICNHSHSLYPEYHVLVWKYCILSIFFIVISLQFSPCSSLFTLNCLFANCSHNGIQLEYNFLIDFLIIIIQVKWSMYWELVKGIGFGHSCLIIILMACYHVCYNVTNVWLSDWTDDVELANFTSKPANSTARYDRNLYYIGIYTALGIGQSMYIFLFLCWKIILVTK